MFVYKLTFTFSTGRVSSFPYFCRDKGQALDVARTLVRKGGPFLAVTVKRVRLPKGARKLPGRSGGAAWSGAS